jgi:hypothetical protein
MIGVGTLDMQGIDHSDVTPGAFFIIGPNYCELIINIGTEYDERKGMSVKTYTIMATDLSYGRTRHSIFTTRVIHMMYKNPRIRIFFP